jgi:hypothetical protein
MSDVPRLQICLVFSLDVEVLRSLLIHVLLDLGVVICSFFLFFKLQIRRPFRNLRVRLVVGNLVAFEVQRPVSRVQVRRLLSDGNAGVRV